MPFTYNFHNDTSDDPDFKPGEAFTATDAETGESINDIIAYDQRSTRLDRWVDVNGARQVLVELRDVKLVFPDREQTAAQASQSPPAVAEAVAPIPEQEHVTA